MVCGDLSDAAQAISNARAPRRTRQAAQNELARSSRLLPCGLELFSCNLMLSSKIHLGQRLIGETSAESRLILMSRREPPVAVSLYLPNRLLTIELDP